MRQITLAITALLLPLIGMADGVIRINQLGYLPQSVKVAVYLSDEDTQFDTFTVYQTLTGEAVFSGKTIKADGTVWGKKSAYRLDFSNLKHIGGFYIQAGNSQSPSFRIHQDVYDGTADYILTYMRQQRCGYNPYLKDSCHLHDGKIVDHPTRSGEVIDATGGWHDATDYLQYTTTSANAVYQLLFAYQQNPSAFGDQYGANGERGANGIADILDEARWGLEWLIKMNPSKGEMYNQIADDRDHAGFRLPNKDTVSYGLGDTYRPVYFVTGKSQGLGKYKNRTTGVSSTAGKFASSFALGAEIFKSIDPQLSEKMALKAADAYQFALSDLGNTQTASVKSPYIYEEDNWVDDMELAAATLHRLTGKGEYLAEARKWGELEPVTPWMELNRARHYQFYPFVNLGHAWLAQSTDPAVSAPFKALMKQGLESIRARADKDPFLNGIPLIWCSNNLVAAAITQAKLYRNITGDNSYQEMEAALTDWLFGCNPWGTSMICGLPAGGDNPQHPHSSLTLHFNETTFGGLVDGPVYNSIYSNLIGIQLMKPDDYPTFQNGKGVYHDDMGDYSTNEPTMDGTASLSYLLSSLETEKEKSLTNNQTIDSQGAIVRLDHRKKAVYLIFSAHDRSEGGLIVAQTLKKEKAKGSFFFTGEFYTKADNKALIDRLMADGHYLGAHSNGHLLYADWDKRDSTLITSMQFTQDINANYDAMSRLGINRSQAVAYLPPYEWYNRETVDWCRQVGLTVINFTPGIRTNADYTTPGMDNYRSSEQILASLKEFEQNKKDGLNGAIILIHIGTEPSRTDKFYNRLGELLQWLKQKGYATENLKSIM